MKPSKAAKEKNPNPAQPTRVRKSLRLQIPFLRFAVMVLSVRTHVDVSSQVASAKGTPLDGSLHRLKGECVAKRQDGTAKCLSPTGSPGISIEWQPSFFANGIGLAQLRKTEKKERR